MRNTYPLFIVKDIKYASEFFISKFEFKIVFESDWYIQLEHEKYQIAFMIENSQNQPKFLQRNFAGQGFVLTIEVEDVDKIYKNFDKILLEVRTEEWGQRHFICEGPENIIIDIVNYTKPEDYK